MRVSGYLFVLEQFAASLSLLTASGLAAGLTRRDPLRLTLTALMDALAALLAAMHPSAALRLLLLALTLLSPIAAWPGMPRSLRWRMPPVALALTLAMAGCARLMQGFPLPGCLTVLAGCWLIPAFVRAAPRQTFARCVTVDIRLRARRIVLTALVDSGNLLRDPLTGLPVIVVSRRAAQRLLTLPPPGELSPGMRFISVRTVAGSSLMTVFRPDGVRIMQGGAWQSVQAIIGLSPDGYDGAQALVPMSLTQAIPSSAILSQGG